MKHSSVVGGSTVARLLACPGSVELVKLAPKQPASEFANEGNMMHDALESLLMGEPGRDPGELVGFESYGCTLDIDHATDLREALRSWEFIADKYAIDAYDCEVWADWGSVILGAGGTIDVIGTGPTHNLVLDWKMGRGVRVRAKDNKQAQFYAAGAMLDPKLRDVFNPDLPTVVAIVQPRIEDATEWVVVQPAQLRVFIETVKAAHLRSLDSKAPLETGDHCRWCPAKVTCPKKLGVVEYLPEATIAELPRLLGLADEAADWAKAVHVLGHQAAEEGAAIPGWKLVQKRATRKWTDERDAEKALRGPGYRLKVSQICERRLRTPAKIAKILQKKPLPADVVDASSSGTTLAREDDKRPAIIPVAKALADLGKRA